MPVFSDYESLEEFKDRLNSLTEKLNRVQDNAAGTRTKN